jgi:hypothetical protein
MVDWFRRLLGPGASGKANAASGGDVGGSAVVPGSIDRLPCPSATVSASEANEDDVGKAAAEADSINPLPSPTATGSGNVVVGGDISGSPIVSGSGNTIIIQAGPTPAPKPFAVPAPVADFTGRGTEIAALEAALTREGRASICAAVVGLGGVGKSQLAYEACRRLAGALLRAQG